MCECEKKHERIERFKNTENEKIKRLYDTKRRLKKLKKVIQVIDHNMERGKKPLALGD